MIWLAGGRWVRDATHGIGSFINEPAAGYDAAASFEMERFLNLALDLVWNITNRKERKKERKKKERTKERKNKKLILKYKEKKRKIENKE